MKNSEIEVNEDVEHNNYIQGIAWTSGLHPETSLTTVKPLRRGQFGRRKCRETILVSKNAQFFID